VLESAPGDGPSDGDSSVGGTPPAGGDAPSSCLSGGASLHLPATLADVEARLKDVRVRLALCVANVNDVLDELRYEDA
jgi:hypothetical protein